MTSTPNLAPVGPPLVPHTDPVLLPFLEAPDDDSARRRLGELLEGEAAPLAREVIRGHLRGPGKDDIEDVHAGVLLSLAEHLRALRRGGGEASIRSFAGYVAAVSHNACHAFLRERFPARARLRSRTRYVLTRDPGLALWEGKGREWLCGKAAWRDASCDPGSASRLLELSRRLGAFVDGERRGAGPLPFPELVRAVVGRLQGPARFDDLVDAIAGIQGISDQAQRSAPEEDGRESDPVQDAPDPAPSPEEALSQKGFLSRLWAEILLLPGRQRAALLLNLRDADGRGMIGLFPLTGTAGLPDLARALDMPEERLRALWSELPRDDEWIAGRLSLTRRQVINLRKCARERLARRLRSCGGW
jgi:DNA-directed RNA polymerase specialized sigma24 family protein